MITDSPTGGNDNGYPMRPKYWAHKVTRLVFKSCLAQDIGHHACMLVIHVVHTEDAARYQKPVRFWNSQLMETLCLDKNQLNRARKRAVAAGWLHYEREHSRSVGRYWVTVPADCQGFDDSPIEKTGQPDSASQRADSPNDSASQRAELCAVNDAHCVPPSYPTPDPSPKKSRKLRFQDDDSALAGDMLAAIHKVVPNVKPPNLDRWANDIRLMRERDNRTLAAIRANFQWANQDGFWQANILSPDSLRRNFDKLTAQKERTHGRKQHAIGPGQRHATDSDSDQF